MYILGLTGGIGSGKTTVSNMFSKFNIPVICADKVVHKLYSNGTEQYNQIKGLFGEAVLNEERELDRQKISEILKNNPSCLEKLEAILHPAVRQEMLNQIDYHREHGEHLVLIDVPLMFQTGADKICQSVAVCICNDENIRKERTLKRENMNEDKWLMITANQLSKEEFIEKADHIIPTDTTIQETEVVVKNLIQKLRN